MSDPYYISGDELGEHASRVRLLVGPFETAEHAEAWVGRTQDALLFQGRIDLAIRTRVTRLIGKSWVSRPGDLNDELGFVGAPC